MKNEPFFQVITYIFALLLFIFVGIPFIFLWSAQVIGETMVMVQHVIEVGRTILRLLGVHI